MIYQLVLVTIDKRNASNLALQEADHHNHEISLKRPKTAEGCQFNWAWKKGSLKHKNKQQY